MPNCSNRNRLLVIRSGDIPFQIGEGDKLINVVLLNGERLNVRVQVNV